MTLSVAEEANTSSAGDNRACSNGKGRKNKCSGSEGVGTGNGDSSKTGPLCDGGRQREELLCLWEFWAYGPSLQELRKGKSNGREKNRIWREKIRGQH